MLLGCHHLNLKRPLFAGFERTRKVCANFQTAIVSFGTPKQEDVGFILFGLSNVKHGPFGDKIPTRLLLGRHRGNFAPVAI